MTPTGILAAAVTPRRNLTIDAAASSELISFLASKCVAGVVLFGSTGEFVHFDLADRARLVRELTRRNKLPILVNVSHSTLDGTIELARRALADGAAAAVAMPPYYFHYTQPQIREFFLRLGDAVDGPLSLYNIPLFTGRLELATAVELLKTGRFCALKDSSGDNTYIEALIKLNQPGVRLYAGADHAYRALKAKGAHGAVSGVSSVAPEILLAIDSGDDLRVSAGERHLTEFLRWFVQFPIPFAISQALNVRCGFPSTTACPLDPETAKSLEHFRSWCKEWFPVMEAECK